MTSQYFETNVLLMQAMCEISQKVARIIITHAMQHDLILWTSAHQYCLESEENDADAEEEPKPEPESEETEDSEPKSEPEPEAESNSFITRISICLILILFV